MGPLEEDKDIINESTPENSITSSEVDQNEEVSENEPNLSTYQIIKESFKLSFFLWKYYLLMELAQFTRYFIHYYITIYESEAINSATSDMNYDNFIYNIKLYGLLVAGYYLFETIYPYLEWIFVENSEVLFHNIVLEKIANNDIEFFDKYKTGEIKKFLDTSSDFLYSNSLVFCIEVMFDMFSLSFFIYSAYLISGILSILLIISATFAVINVFFEFYLQNKIDNAEITDENVTKYANLLNEFISSIRIIKSFCCEVRELTKLFELKRKQPIYLKEDVEKVKYLSSFLNDLCTVIFLFTIGYLTLKGELTFGHLNILVNFSADITVILIKMKLYKDSYNLMLITTRTFIKVCSFENKVVSIKNLLPSNIEGNITFDKVTFSYPLSPDVTILQDLSFSIKKGELTAIVGKSGSGKSTLLNLLSRFYNVSSGTIKIDNINIEDINVKYYRSLIGLVSQNLFLVDGNIEENITYGIDKYQQDELNEICKLSLVNHFVSNKEFFPDGLRTLVGEKGTKLSGGQKQRITFARAIMKKPKILLLDEATSALDSETESEILKTIDYLKKEKNLTIIVVAHRLSTIKSADKILVLDQGKIVETGTHDELIKINGEYKKLIEKQLN